MKDDEVFIEFENIFYVFFFLEGLNECARREVNSLCFRWCVARQIKSSKWNRILYLSQNSMKKLKFYKKKSWDIMSQVKSQWMSALV